MRYDLACEKRRKLNGTRAISRLSVIKWGKIEAFVRGLFRGDAKRCRFQI